MRLLRLSPIFLGILSGVLPTLSLRSEPVSEARQVLQDSGVSGGFVVHVGAGDGQLTSALKAGEGFQVLGLEKDPALVVSGRNRLADSGAYGPVAMETWEGGSLPFVENLVNLLVIEQAGSVSRAEIDRVLVPQGVAMIRRSDGWEKVVKPRPAEMDDWTHYFYDSRGNAVSRDTAVGPPSRLQWVGSPRWSRHHDRMSSLSAMVSAGGRLFYIMDAGSRISILLPAKWQLVARDAFNGTILWKNELGGWNDYLWPLKSGPTQMTRRLVTDGKSVFVTKAVGAPVSKIDAATGEELSAYAGTQGAEEIIHRDGTLFVLVNPGDWALKDYAPVFNTGDQKRVETEFNWDQKPRRLVAVDAATGKTKWEYEGKIAPLTLCTDGKRVIFSNGDGLMCLNPADGTTTWADAPVAKRALYEYNYGPRVVLHDEVVLYAGGDGKMKGLRADTGKELWISPHEKSGYRSPEDLMVAGGLVWNAGTTQGNQSGEFTGRDPVTGEVKKQFLPDVTCYWFHHRCYMAKATEKFLIPSRTGIEYVDIEKEHWDINHWVRGACLYGVLPANGLTYAGPHNCACYPEAKLDGMNALAPAAKYPLPEPIAESARLSHGPAWGQPIEETEADPADWPTYRRDNARSGASSQALAGDLGKAWEIDLPGRLSALTIAAGSVFVAQIDAHTVHALDATTGKKRWRFIAGGRVDSPPTYWKGRVLFGSMDGSVYALRASDGALIWKFHAAPREMRHFAFEQLESVAPVHGSLLVENGLVSFVAGRSCFLDGGLRFFRLDAATGEKKVEQIYDDLDPDTGEDLQTKHMTLQMPVGLNDVLSSDGTLTYLRSQKIGADGKRIDIGPVSGDAAQQGAAQKGPGAHIFAPMGFLDDSWFHRSYWVYGKSFAGGHNGYYQAGKYAPAGRILVFNDSCVYSYGREAQYLKWTTTMEHSLFATSKVAPDAPEPVAQGGAGNKKGKAKEKNKAAAKAPNPLSGAVAFPADAKLDPSGQPLSLQAWVLPDGGQGIIIQHGGPQQGYSLELKQGIPAFHLRRNQDLFTLAAPKALGEGWHQLVATLDAKGAAVLYIDGESVATGQSPGVLTAAPANGLTMGNARMAVSNDDPTPYTGLLDQAALYHRALSAEEVRERFAAPDAPLTDVVVAASFDNGDARDEANALHGVTSGVETGKGRVGAALWFRKGAPAGKAGAKAPAASQKNSFVERQWDRYVPIVTRAMALAGDNVIVAGPPDTLDEEYAFERLTQKDPAIREELVKQAEALDGKSGAKLWSVNVKSGEQSGGFDLESPPVWDGMAVARGRLYVASVDGKVLCFGKP